MRLGGGGECTPMHHEGSTHAQRCMYFSVWTKVTRMDTDLDTDTSKDTGRGTSAGTPAPRPRHWGEFNRNVHVATLRGRPLRGMQAGRNHPATNGVPTPDGHQRTLTTNSAEACPRGTGVRWMPGCTGWGCPSYPCAWSPEECRRRRCRGVPRRACSRRCPRRRGSSHAAHTAQCRRRGSPGRRPGGARCSPPTT